MAWWSGRPEPAPWTLLRAEIAAVRFDGLVVRPGQDGPCGEAVDGLFDAIEEGRAQARRVDGVDHTEAGLAPGTTIRIETRRGEAITRTVGRSSPVAGRTWVEDAGTVWAVRGGLREAIDQVDASCRE